MLDVGRLSLSQKSGNIIARNLEVQVYANKAQEFFVKQFQRFADATEGAVAGIRRAASSPDPDSFETAWKIHNAWGKQKAATIAAANREYGAKLARVLSHAGVDSNKFPLPFDNLESVTSKWASETGGQPWWRKIHPGAERMAPEFEALDGYLRGLRKYNADLNNPAGPLANAGAKKIGTAFEGISVQEMIRVRKALNNEDQAYWRAVNAGQQPSPAQLDAHRAVKELKGALDADIDAYLAKADPDLPSVKALNEFRQANVDHEEFWEMQRMMSNTTTAQWFGGRIADDPDKALQRLAGMSPSQQVRLVNVLNSTDPEALADFRAVLVNRAVRAMRNAPGREAGRGTIDPDRFRQFMTDEVGEVLGGRLFTPAQTAQLNRAMDTIRVLANGPEGVVSVSRATSLESGAMAFISWSRAFLTRVAVRAVGLGKVEDLLFSEEGLKALETVRNAYGGDMTKATVNQLGKAVGKIAAATGVTGEIPDEYVTFTGVGGDGEGT
jgi:hypothetical protein